MATTQDRTITTASGRMEEGELAATLLGWAPPAGKLNWLATEDDASDVEMPWLAEMARRHRAAVLGRSAPVASLASLLFAFEAEDRRHMSALHDYERESLLAARRREMVPPRPRIDVLARAERLDEFWARIDDAHRALANVVRQVATAVHANRDEIERRYVLPARLRSELIGPLMGTPGGSPMELLESVKEGTLADQARTISEFVETWRPRVDPKQYRELRKVQVAA